jgi:hypothetical protein
MVFSGIRRPIIQNIQPSRFEPNNPAGAPAVKKRQQTSRPVPDVRSGSDTTSVGWYPYDDGDLSRISVCERGDAEIAARVKTLETQITHLVSQAEFHPVKALVYGFVGLVMTGVIAALLFSVITHGSSSGLH